MITGREREQAILNKLLHSKRAEFLAIYGRRRVGKTFLIHEFFKDKGIYLEITGSNKASKSEQLMNFHKEFAALFPEEAPTKAPKNWSDAFDLVLSIVRKINPHTKFIFFSMSSLGFHLPNLDF